MSNTDTELLTDLKKKFRALAVEKTELEKEIGNHLRPTYFEKKIGVNASQAEYLKIKKRILDVEIDIKRVKELIIEAGENKTESERNLWHSICKQNFSDEMMKKCYDFIENGDPNKELVLSLNDTQKEIYLNRISRLKNRLHIELKTLKEIRNEMRILTDNFERTLNRAEFAQTIKILSNLNRAIPLDTDISKRIIDIPKL